MTQNSRLEIGPFSRLEKSDGRFAVAEDSHNWSLCETKCKKWDKFFRNFFHCLCLNGTGANPNSESATAKRSLTILPQSAIPGLVKPNSESPLSLSAKYKQPVYVFLYCIPDSCLLCYPTPICKICPPQPQRDLRPRCEIPEKTNRKCSPMVGPEENFTWRHLALSFPWLPSPP